MSNNIMMTTTIAEHEYKTCSHCNTNQSRTGFRKDRNRKDGLYPWCKDCEKRERQRRSKRNNPDYEPRTKPRVNRISLAKDGSKRCSKCEEIKPISEFFKNRARQDGLAHYCKTCQYIAVEESNRRHPESKKRRSRKTYLKRTYGLTPYQYELLFMKQDGKCALCGQEMDRPHVDHDHSCCPGKETCGKCVRGMLCLSCNTSLSYYEDVARMKMALAYLDFHQEKIKGRSKAALDLLS